ncbi:NAD(P)/FAD-dependent oxidoreductase [Roseomonas sp. M0104]|uniref:NAD(P)/FAD-dependent oxidoreductase n=1 Tax=Teichococcus coralli TaxID=2545983 RepID=A0A845BDC3_9PROT|nr:FAD-dependent monooxygenase [Pseudoroseomonas coralli]MXP64044.1 NAD(P)/FAD-dependent oxidoreductase [Pseudoroseomonas coralli]
MPGLERFDVLVAGARCAGAAAAMLMARQGLRVLVVERGAYGRDTLSTHALMRGGVLLLRRWGVLERLVEAGTPPIRHATFHYGDEAVPLEIRPGDGVDALYAPRRTLLDSALADAAGEAGAELRYGHSLAGLLQDEAGRVTGARIVDPAGRRSKVEAGLVVGADGAGSTVARLAGAPVLAVGRNAAPVVYGYWSGLTDHGTHWHYRPGLSAGRIPTNAGHHCVFVAAAPARLRSVAHEDRRNGFLALLRAAAPALAEEVAAASPEGDLLPFAGRRGFMRHPCGPGWALIGDAASFKDPSTAHGITDALRDAALLAGAVARNTPAAFSDFADRRDALLRPLFQVTDAVAGHDWDLTTLKSLHRTLNQVMRQEVEHLLALAAPAELAA